MAKRMMNYGKSKHPTAKDDGGPYAKTPQTNHSGAKMTKLSGGASKRQMNFGGTVKVSVKHDDSPGKSGTGCSGGY